MNATRGNTRVRLAWQPLAAVAGYFVERHLSTGTNNAWVRLNSHLLVEPRYDDPIGKTSDVTMEYRIIAVTFDSVESQPSAFARVTLPDISIPDPPTINAATSLGGKAQLGFEPAPPSEKIASFLVLRSGADNETGVVIGDPLPPSARNYSDPYVKPGEHYYYRIVTVGKNGNRSNPSRPVIVTVGAPQLAAPQAPSALFAATPFAHVTLTFAAPVNGLAVIVERQTSGTGPWMRIAGPTSGTTVTDFDPRPGMLQAYRISYQAANGTLGPASVPAQVAVPGSK